jgi:diguanylate cyclase (GGDEF)-like protein
MGRQRILIIDRNEKFVEKSRAMLRELGHEVNSCRNADDGVRAVINWRPDLVIANALISDVEELDFTPRAKEVDPALPVILLFSKDTEQVQELFEQSGADNYLIRPLKQSELVAAVRSVASLRELRLKLEAVTEERDTLARETAGSSLEREARERFYQFEFFKKIINIEIKRSKRYHFPLSLMLVAFDESERIAGSPYERQLFGALARVIREGLRDIDIPITFSEETILVLMPHTDLEGIKVVANRIREHAAALPETYGVVEYSTVSIGAVCSQGVPRLEFGPLMQQVTRALREAKRAGGDQLVIA